jgi:hypothetical protein
MSLIAGFVMMVGTWATLQFFMRRTKIKGAIVFFSGLVMIIVGFPFFTTIGFLLQIYGGFLLFRYELRCDFIYRSFMKTIFGYMQTMPVIGGFLSKFNYLNFS